MEHENDSDIGYIKKQNKTKQTSNVLKEGSTWLFETIYWFFDKNAIFYFTKHWEPCANNQIC